MNIRLVLITLLSIGALSQCKTPYKLQTKVPFTITKAVYQDWVGGVPGNSGTLVILSVSDTLGIQPDSLFFRNKVAVIDKKPASKGILWVAHFRKERPNEIRLNTDNVATIEVDNIVFPFELRDNEAILSYYKKDRVHYYKIVKLVQKETIFYPTARPKGQ